MSSKKLMYVKEPLLLNAFCISTELCLNSINACSHSFIINIHLNRGEISCHDDGKGISSVIFDKFQLSSSSMSFLFRNPSLSFTIITKTDEEGIANKYENGQLEKSYQKMNHGCEIKISGIPIPNNYSEISSKIETYFRSIALVNYQVTMSLNIKSPTHNFSVTYLSANTIEDRWKQITNSEMLFEICSDHCIINYFSDISLCSSLFTNFIVNGIPCNILDSSFEIRRKQNSVSVLKADIQKIEWLPNDIIIKCNPFHSKEKEIQKSDNNSHEIRIGRKEIEKMEIVGIFARKFIICRIQSMIYAIDQHAAHERVNLENLLRTFSVSEKKLPKLVELPIARGIILKNSTLSVLRKWKWKIVSTNEKCSLYSIPVVSGVSIDNIKELMEYINKLEEMDNPEIIINDIPNVIYHAIQTKACKSAIKFGDIISKSFAESLLKQLSQCELPNLCAHGRTVVAPLVNVENLFFEFKQK